MCAATAPNWRARRRRVIQSVFPSEISQPTPHSTPAQGFPEPGQAFGGPNASLSTPPRRRDHGTGLGLNVGASPTSADTFILPEFEKPSPRANQGPQSTHQTYLEQQARLDRAWHWVTSRLSLPTSATAEDSFGSLAPESQVRSSREEDQFDVALGFVIFPKVLLPRAAHSEDLFTWHNGQIRRHFAQYVVPLLKAIVVPDEVKFDSAEAAFEAHMTAMQGEVQTLTAALRQYLYILSRIMRGYKRQWDILIVSGQANASTLQSRNPKMVQEQFQDDLRAFLSNSAAPLLKPSIAVVMMALIPRILQFPVSRSSKSATSKLATTDSETLRRHLLSLMRDLREVGLGSETVQTTFAEIMDACMLRFIRQTYAKIWDARPRESFVANQIDGLQNQASWCIAHLSDWIENHFARLCVEVLNNLTNKDTNITYTDVKNWKATALCRLATLRITELFDVVLAWPASQGAIDDLKATVTTPDERLRLTASFSKAVQERLLHPGCSTLQILRVYISMIRAFHTLDQSKVLLSRVATAVQLYLCQRDDAIRTVVAGLLASTEEIKMSEKSDAKHAKQSDDKLVELAVILNDPAQASNLDIDDEALDWDDPNWLPDPVDAGPNYKRPKSEDVIGTLINALGSQDVFVTEFQNILAERLLEKRHNDLKQEAKVLDLLKRRFGETALQNCDVMMKDIVESFAADVIIRSARVPVSPSRSNTDVLSLSSPWFRETAARLDAAEARARYVPFTSRILSRLYWPEAISQTSAFLLPTAIAEQEKDYESGFEALKANRKLTWLHHLGHATVELELKDRNVTVDCKTYEASVIYAFQPGPAGPADDENGDESITRSVEQLQEMLEMDEELVYQAVDFWVEKGVLAHQSTNPDVYAVLEEVDTSPATRPPLHPAASAPAALEGEPSRLLSKTSAGASIDAQRSGSLATTLKARQLERRTLYWNFVVGMLTNSGMAMPLTNIAMMMKMMIPDGFSWSNEELQGFLGEKIAEGELEVIGGKYKLIKK